MDASCSGTATQSANPVPVLPGQCITYVVTATNQGTATVSNMSINDAVPSFTTLYTTLPGTCTSTGITGTAPAYSITSGNGAVSCGSTTNAVAAGGTATLTFTVQVNQ